MIAIYILSLLLSSSQAYADYKPSITLAEGSEVILTEANKDCQVMEPSSGSDSSSQCLKPQILGAKNSLYCFEHLCIFRPGDKPSDIYYDVGQRDMGMKFSQQYCSLMSPKIAKNQTGNSTAIKARKKAYTYAREHANFYQTRAIACSFALTLCEQHQTSVEQDAVNSCDPTGQKTQNLEAMKKLYLTNTESADKSLTSFFDFCLATMSGESGSKCMEAYKGATVGDRRSEIEHEMNVIYNANFFGRQQAVAATTHLPSSRPSDSKEINTPEITLSVPVVGEKPSESSSAALASVPSTPAVQKPADNKNLENENEDKNKAGVASTTVLEKYGDALKTGLGVFAAKEASKAVKLGSGTLSEEDKQRLRNGDAASDQYLVGAAQNYNLAKADSRTSTGRGSRIGQSQGASLGTVGGESQSFGGAQAASVSGNGQQNSSPASASGSSGGGSGSFAGGGSAAGGGSGSFAGGGSAAGGGGFASDLEKYLSPQKFFGAMKKALGFTGENGKKENQKNVRRGSSRLAQSLGSTSASATQQAQLQSLNKTWNSALGRVEASQRGIASVNLNGAQGLMGRRANIFQNICHHYSDFQRNSKIETGRTRCPSK